MKMRFIDSPPSSGAFNMACDYYFAENVAEEDCPVLRLYSWNPPAISLGFHQRTTDIDFNACWNDGIDIVRRPTGGRAILHWGEITYCLVVPIPPDYGKKALQNIYSKVHSGILNALEKAGAEVVFAGADKKPQPHNPLCFASSAGTELEMSGRKVVGSAQRLLNSAVLQHGSILLTPQHLKIPEYLNIPPEKKEEMRIQLSSKSTNLHLTDSPDLRMSIAENISLVFDSELQKLNLKDSEISAIVSNMDCFRVFQNSN